MSSQLRVDNILPSAGTALGIGTASGSITFNSSNISGDVIFNDDVTVNGLLTYDDVTNIDSIGIITARSDVSIADKIVHTGDTDTAIRFPGADQVSIETGGTQRLLIGSDGKLVHSTSAAETVDFGTSNSSGSYHKYDLGSSGATVGYIGAGSQIVSGSNVADFGIRSQANLVFSSGGDTERLRITSDGKFGYGTQTPGCFFEVSDDAAGATVQQKLINRNTAANSSTNQFIYVNNSGAGDPFTTWTVGGVTSWSMGIDNSDSDKLKIAAASNLNSNQYLTLDTSGNIGINKTPSTKLDILNGSDASVIVSIEGADSSSEYLGFGINSGEAVITAGGNGSTSNALVFRTAPSGTETERLRIASDGNVTLGYAGNSLYFQNGFNNRASRIQNGGASGSADLKFYTNNAGTEAERLRINSNGCLQVGEPSGTPGEVMQIRKASGDVEVITYAAAGQKTIFNCTGSNRFALERGYNSVFEIQDPNGNGVRGDLRFDGNIILNKNMGELNNSAVQLYRLIGPQNLSLGNGMAILGSQTDTISTKAAKIGTSNTNGTAWFGPYGAIHPGSYTAMFHMKVSNNSNTNTIIRIDVSGPGCTDAGGYGDHRPRALNLSPSHFDNADRYQYVGLDFNFVNAVGSNVIEVRGLNFNNSRGADLYLDHILIVPRIPSHDG